MLPDQPAPDRRRAARSGTARSGSTRPVAAHHGNFLAQALREGSIAMWIVAVLMLLGLGIWAGSTLMNGKQFDDRPQPTWMKLPTVETQMSDGKMLSVEVSLQMLNQRTEFSMDNYKVAMTALVHKQLLSKSRKDFAGPDGMVRLSNDIKKSLNALLRERGADERVESVEFQQFVLLP